MNGKMQISKHTKNVTPCKGWLRFWFNRNVNAIQSTHTKDHMTRQLSDSVKSNVLWDKTNPDEAEHGALRMLNVSGEFGKGIRQVMSNQTERFCTHSLLPASYSASL